jgi:hypothetical protein
MNVFEDLVIELQQENLLESTVIDRTEGFAVPSVADLPVSVADERFPDEIDIDPIDIPDEVQTSAPVVVPPTEQNPKPGKQVFHKKAAAEVSSLQMVEHLITGVEREYMKTVPKPFDDFNVKKALSALQNIDGTVSSDEHSSAEFNLMRETEAWCSALACRDREVTVSALRQFVEGSRPALSSQALLALGRFYRNLPYDENVRSKFDFVITRLFSRPSGNEKRVCLFNLKEMIGHINTLYGDWSSIPIYDADDDEGKVSLTAMSFADLLKEAKAAPSFDALIETDFFGRLRMFKESINELFYAPEVTASAIECNIEVGNVYVSLIDKERQKFDANSLLVKYGDHDTEISAITGKSLNIADLLVQLSQVDDEVEQEPLEEEIHATRPAPSRSKQRTLQSAAVKKKANKDEGIFASIASVNRWYLVFAAVMLTAAVGLYIWGNYAAGENVSTAGVKTLQLDNPILKEHIKMARISGDTLYAEMLPSWDVLPKEKRQEFLQKTYAVAKENGCVRVDLIASNGKNAGFASATRLDVVMP